MARSGPGLDLNPRLAGASRHMLSKKAVQYRWRAPQETQQNEQVQRIDRHHQSAIPPCIASCGSAVTTPRCQVARQPTQVLALENSGAVGFWADDRVAPARPAYTIELLSRWRYRIVPNRDKRERTPAPAIYACTDGLRLLPRCATRGEDALDNGEASSPSQLAFICRLQLLRYLRSLQLAKGWGPMVELQRGWARRYGRRVWRACTLRSNASPGLGLACRGITWLASDSL